MSSKQSRASICMALGMLAMANYGHVAAQEDTSISSPPHTFKSGDVISAEQMNENFEQMNQNFSAIVDAIAVIKAASGTQGDVGPAGPAGPAGIAIKDAGTFAGSVETASSGGNFSLLPGAGGATGAAAADAACEVNYPGSHAEMDTLALWQSVADGELPPGHYWGSSQSGVPVNKEQNFTSDCGDWTETSGYGNVVTSRVDSYSSVTSIYIGGFDSCSIDPPGNEMLIACYMDQ